MLMKSRLISGGVWALSGKLIVAFCSLAINAMLARLLSPEEMGVYFIVITWVAIAALLAQLGLSTAVIKLLGAALGRNDLGAARGVIRAAIGWALLGAAVMSVVTYAQPGRWAAIALFDAPAMLWVLGATAVIVALTSLQNLVAETLRGFGDIPKATATGGLITSIVFVTVLAVYMVSYGRASLQLVMWGNAVALLAAMALGAYWLIRAYKSVSIEPAKPATGLASLAAPMLLISICSFVLMQADLWILGMYQPQAQVALYGAASRLAGTLWMISAVVTAVLAPVVARKCARGETRDVEKLLRAAATASALAALPLVAAFAVFSSEILALIYGPYYAQGAPVLAFLSVGLFTNILLGMRGYVLLMTGHEHALMRVMLMSAALNIVGCSIAARYGSLGWVAVAAVGANLFSYLLEVWLVRKTTGIWTFFSVHAINTVQEHITRYLSPETKNVECTQTKKKAG